MGPGATERIHGKSRRWGLGLAALLFLTSGVAMVPAGTPEDLRIEGDFEVERDHRGSGELDEGVWLRMRLGRHNTFGTQIPERAFHRLENGQVEVRREAGSFLFRGLDLDRSGRQKGQFLLVADPTYIEAMAKRGYRDLGERRLFELAALDLTTGFIDDLAAVGYEESLDRLIEMLIHGVDASYVNDLASAGYRGIAAKKLVEMSIHGVDGHYVGELKRFGYADLPAHRLVEMRIHGVDPTWLGELVEMGYESLSTQRLVEMRIHGVSAPWLREISTLGYKTLPAQRLVEMRIHGVEPAWIRGLQELGYGKDDVSAKQLVEMRIHGVSPAWIRGLGEQKLSPRRLIERRIHGG